MRPGVRWKRSRSITVRSFGVGSASLPRIRFLISKPPSSLIVLSEAITWPTPSAVFKRWLDHGVTVFFGENVPRDVVATAHDHLAQADAMLIVGSSLMVYSGFRFVQAAAKRHIPIAAVNLGRTRADDLLTLKVEERCESALAFLL